MNTAALVKRQRRPVTYSLPQPEYANKHVGGVNAVDLEERDPIAYSPVGAMGRFGCGICRRGCQRARGGLKVTAGG